MCPGSLKLDNHTILDIIRESGGATTKTSEDIKRATGITERRWCDPDQNENAATLGIRAAQIAINQAGIEPHDIDCLICSGVVPYYGFDLPNTASVIAGALGMRHDVPSFPINVACSGFIYGLMLADSLLTTTFQRILLVCSEVISLIINKKQFEIATLFGDAAGAIVLERQEKSPYGIRDVRCYMWPDETSLVIPAGGSKTPLTPERMREMEHMIHMQGRAVYRTAVAKFTKMIYDSIARNNLPVSCISIYPHQANLRIIQEVAVRTEIPFSKFYVNIQRYGNTSSASIPLALCEAVEEGRLKKGDHIVLAAVGAGISGGSAYLVWGS